LEVLAFVEKALPNLKAQEERHEPPCAVVPTSN
jgi:hypothetical protein